jgi:nucleoside diphosphate kinase
MKRIGSALLSYDFIIHARLFNMVQRDPKVTDHGKTMLNSINQRLASKQGTIQALYKTDECPFTAALVILERRSIQKGQIELVRFFKHSMPIGKRKTFYFIIALE